ncbi:GNAT family N-acetyltransferase [Mycobacterium sp.]|jgi:phosphinothricin acetyltransferase|uniref:GNAT family N-acetyltransferase n=1 Tax=Mycobacterium sp. TaxID=1785 RepID=UPI00261A434B|nr:GNAT family N-acetyltransferase [Mycobacterium sp.]
MAVPEDAGAIAEIYLPYVRDTAASFEAVPPGVEEMRSRMTSTLPTLPWLVVTDGESVKGYAYANPHRPRDSYRWCADVSLYLDASIHGRGHGRRIYTALLNLLVAQGYINAYAAITLPNPASVGLHKALGFTPVGVFPGVGFKQERWWDVGWWHRRLADLPQSPRGPKPWAQLAEHTVNSALEAKPPRGRRRVDHP